MISAGHDHMGIHAGEGVQPEASDAVQHSTDLVVLRFSRWQPVNLRNQDSSLFLELCHEVLVAVRSCAELFQCQPVQLQQLLLELIQC